MSTSPRMKWLEGDNYEGQWSSNQMHGKEKLNI